MFLTNSWATADIDGGPADVFDPPGGRPRFAVIDLHDLDLRTLRQRPEFGRLLAEYRLGCVCPHGGPCWWVDRHCPAFGAHLTPAQYVRGPVLAFIRSRWGLAPPAVGIQGIGMGGQGALRLAFRHPQTFPVVAAIAPAIDYHEVYGRGTPLDAMYDSKEHCRQDTALMHVPPSGYPPHIFFCADPEDGWYRGCDRLHEKLNALGIPHEADLITSAGGHTDSYLDRFAVRAERFVLSGLERESRRLL